MKPLLCITFFAIVFVAAGLSLQRQNSHSAYTTLCKMVSERYYSQSSRLQKWKDECFENALQFENKSQQFIIEQLRSELSKLGGSHLELYEPVEHQRMWASRSSGDTGLRARFIEGELVIYEVVPESPADRVGIRPGAIIRSINSEHPSENSAQFQTGEFEILSKEGFSKKHWLELATLELDQSPKVEALNSQTAHLRVASFRGDYFKDKQWTALTRELNQFENIVVDLRGNLGGNLIAGMRLLGSLLCRELPIGDLLRSQVAGPRKYTLANELSDERQIRGISRAQTVQLQSFVGPECKSLGLTVLIDHDSSSTAEIVALALKDHGNARLMGTPSAGRVLIAVWYAFPELGAGYSLSIPERRFVSAKGVELEGKGLLPDETLYYKLKEARLGKDSWLSRAERSFAQPRSVAQVEAKSKN